MGEISGSFNLSVDPMFVDAFGLDGQTGTEDDDLRLQPSSPAIDQGSDSFGDYSVTDLVGVARAGAPDLGAYEFFINSGPSDYRGVNLSYMDLTGQDLSGALFDGSTVFSDGINGVNLSGTGANLSELNLSGCLLYTSPSPRDS